ncbi:uncharacterized protein LOC105695105 [Orussus abietinus]|uniref:uncharacterized protein LOC105695105 n=1 Tax=Orussus abietinus TaxID=222816 RepID=UPI0006260D6E|nr:uncharacterized protein LOC105695105 [Orussus abietinus]
MEELREPWYEKYAKLRYFNAPDGEDLLGKLWGSGRIALLTGINFGLLDALVLSRPFRVPTLNNLAYSTMPLLGIATTFTSVTYAATNIRGKDDVYNYVLGAAATAPVTHLWLKKPFWTFNITLFFIFAAVTKKLVTEAGGTFFPDQVKRMELLRSTDLTLVKKHPHVLD